MPPMHRFPMPMSSGMPISGASPSLPHPLHRQLAASRPRAMSYTEGDAFVSFQVPLRPRSNTLSDEDAVGALLSFGSAGQARRDAILERAGCIVPGDTSRTPQQRHGGTAALALVAHRRIAHRRTPENCEVSS